MLMCTCSNKGSVSWQLSVHPFSFFCTLTYISCCSHSLYALQAERYLPYYFSPSEQPKRPIITSSSSEQVALGSLLTVSYTGTVTSAVLTQPATVTHQNNMNQRAIKLEMKAGSQPGELVLEMPPSSGVVAPPGYYMLWLLNDDLPCTQAAWIQLTF